MQSTNRRNRIYDVLTVLTLAYLELPSDSFHCLQDA